MNCQNKCKTCKHWDTSDSFTYSHYEMGTCNKIPHEWNAFEWADDGNGRTLKEEYKDVLAIANDASSYYADLSTFAEFGCVMHEIYK